LRRKRAVGGAQGQIGIGSQYPGDVGIEKGPAVIFAEDFGSGDLSQWEGGHGRTCAKVTSDPANVHSGRFALEWRVPKNDTGGHIYRWLKPGYDEIHARVYWKLAEDWCVTKMHGWGISAAKPEISVPGNAGRRADGTNKFCAIVDAPHRNLSLYVYYPEQKSEYGDRFGTGVAMEPGHWYCVEVMQKANTPGRSDGEMALWVDGKEVGRWSDLRFRDVPELRLNKVFLMLYIHRNDTSLNRCFYDDLVVATEYIGPQALTAPEE